MSQDLTSQPDDGIQYDDDDDDDNDCSRGTVDPVRPPRPASRLLTIICPRSWIYSSQVFGEVAIIVVVETCRKCDTVLVYPSPFNF